MKIYTNPVIYHCTIHQSNNSYPYLLMLHGFMGSERAFSHLIEPLTAFCNPITIDLAGHGKSSKSDNPAHYFAQKQVSDLISIINRLQREPLHLYGYSMGGRLAYQLITHTPDMFQSAFIESAHCGITDNQDKQDRLKNDELKAQKIENDYPEFINNWVKQPLFSQSQNQLSETYTEIMSDQDPASMASSLRGFGAGVMPVVCSLLNSIHHPVYLISGKNDQKYVKLSDEISSGIDSMHHITVPDAGHRVHVDQPEQIIEILRSKLSLS